MGGKDGRGRGGRDHGGSGENGKSQGPREPRPLRIPEGRAPTAEEIASNDAEIEARRQEAIRLQANGKKREDQFQCPLSKCRNWGCPAQCTRTRPWGIRRRRRCTECQESFNTVQRYVNADRPELGVLPETVVASANATR